jgi:hypothetical protein
VSREQGADEGEERSRKKGSSLSSQKATGRTGSMGISNTLGVKKGKVEVASSITAIVIAGRGTRIGESVS